MPVEDPELDALFREMPSQMARESCQTDDALGPRDESLRTERRVSITLRLKPDRRSVVTCIDPGLERRRR
jgi:hypothetical protein